MPAALYDEVGFGADQMAVSRQQSTDLKRRAPLRNMAAQPGYRGAVPFNLQTFRPCAFDSCVGRDFMREQSEGNS
jgi:hypothetical protein